MYDIILISTHYNYTSDGKPIPLNKSDEVEDLSMDIPLGIIHLAQYLYNCGIKVRVVHIPHEMHHLRRFGFDDNLVNSSVEKILKNYPAHVCGIQVHWYLYTGGAIFISNLYKTYFPESKIFLGGYMATACWKEFLKASKNIDGVILGEGEKTFKNIFDKLLTSSELNLNDVEGLAFRVADQGIIYNPPRHNSVLKLDEIPVIHPDSPPFKSICWQKRHFINISRGLCPEKCAYCVGNNRAINTRSYQTLKIDQILEQLRIYHKFGLRELFLGENHFLNIPFMTELIENIIAENLTLHFELETHPVVFENKKLLEKMIQAKFYRYTMGCESGSNSLLKRMGRRSNSAQIHNSVKEIAERGGIVLTSWITNLPGETELEFRETQQTMQDVVKAGGFIYWIENLHVLPGSKLYENPQRWEIEIIVNNLEDWIRWSVLSKKYVTFDEACQEPLTYLTHLNINVSPEEMIERFYSNRKLALRLIPDMRSNLARNSKNISSDILDTENGVLDWYEAKGWKLWLF